MQDDMTDDMNQLQVGDINWWMMWIAYITCQVNCIK
jgi:hypothetical protein